MTERRALSKKLRFDVFKRDAFKCAYCGATPSEEAVLEVDHIRAVADGGTNEMDNLVTACFDCNRGKAATPLTTVPETLEAKAALAQEREAQIRAFYKILEAGKRRRDDEAWSIADVYTGAFHLEGIARTDLQSIKTFLTKLNYYEVTEAMEIAVARKPYSDYAAFKYFCGICWSKIKEAKEG